MDYSYLLRRIRTMQDACRRKAAEAPDRDSRVWELNHIAYLKDIYRTVEAESSEILL